LTAAEESKIVQWLQIAEDWGYPLDRDDVKVYVSTFVNDTRYVGREALSTFYKVAKVCCPFWK
jgi:hypothetical protein